MKQQAAEIENLKASLASKETELKSLTEQLEQEKLARNRAELEQVRIHPRTLDRVF